MLKVTWLGVASWSCWAIASGLAAGLERLRSPAYLATIETQPVERRPLEHEVRMVGKVAVDETRITYISSYVPGRIDRLFVNYTGIFVQKGVHLAEIYSPELLVAQKEYLLALDAAESARKDATRPTAVRETADALLQASRRKLQLWAIPEDQIAELERVVGVEPDQPQRAGAGGPGRRRQLEAQRGAGVEGIGVVLLQRELLRQSGADFDRAAVAGGLGVEEQPERPVAAGDEELRLLRRGVVLGLLHRRSLLYLQKGRGGGVGAYRGAHWHTRGEVRELFAGLPISGLTSSTAVLLGGGGHASRVAERAASWLPLGAFFVAAADVRAVR